MSMKQTMCEFVHGMTCEEVSRFVGGIVRCRDCIRYSLDDYGNTWCAYVASAVCPDDFCAWGERKVVVE